MVEQKLPIITNLHSGIDAILRDKIKQPGGLARQELEDAMFTCGQQLLFDLPEGERIDAHGFAKASTWHQCDHLINLLTNGIDSSRSFSTAPLSVPANDAGLYGAALGTAGGTAYRDGAFIIISDPGKSLAGTKAGDGIKAVLVNPALQSLVPVLREQFDIPILTYDKLGGYLFSIGLIDQERRTEIDQKMEKGMVEIRQMYSDTSLFESSPPVLPVTSEKLFTASNCTISSYNGKDSKMLALKITGNAEVLASAESALRNMGLTDDSINRKSNMLLVMGSRAQEVLRTICTARGENPDVITGRVAGS